ncbi:MAG: hypothetical protein COA36_12820 [Desulfotalea sp.]|nr:MAG: hypothetical protein COA36_12820 [Desulfotalea sp.]
MSADPFIYYPVELSTLRGRLNHSWIANGIINKGLEGILGLWLDARRWHALETEFLELEEEAERFGTSFVKAFSLARLVPILSPLACLPAEPRKMLEKALNSIYLSDLAAEQLCVEYQSSLKLLRKSLRQLRSDWDLTYPKGEKQLRMTIEELLLAAFDLKTVLDLIPKGVMIP